MFRNFKADLKAAKRPSSLIFAALLLSVIALVVSLISWSSWVQIAGWAAAATVIALAYWIELGREVRADMARKHADHDGKR